jgi:hypothetical protein
LKLAKLKAVIFLKGSGFFLVSKILAIILSAFEKHLDRLSELGGEHLAERKAI